MRHLFPAYNTPIPRGYRHAGWKKINPESEYERGGQGKVKGEGSIRGWMGCGLGVGY